MNKMGSLFILKPGSLNGNQFIQGENNETIDCLLSLHLFGNNP